jgi:hypothetical protein
MQANPALTAAHCGGSIVDAKPGGADDFLDYLKR